MSLLVSIHDVAPPHLATVARLRDRLDAWGVARATLLVVPDFHGRHPLERSPDTVAWLRARHAAGDEICLHGQRHLQDARPTSLRQRARAALLTAGEGECLTQDEAARGAMLGAGKRLLEDLLGAPVHGFVAPAWLEPPGFARPLAAAGFRWHEGNFWVDARAGDDGERWTRYRGPVIGFATRTRPRLLASLLWARALAPRLAAAGRRGQPARLALHPGDADAPAVLSAAERVVRALAGLVSRTYREALLPA